MAGRIGAGAFGGVLGAAVTGPVSRRIGIGPAVILVPLAGWPQRDWQQLRTGLAGS